MNKKVKVLSKHEYLIKRFIELPVSIITFEEISHAKVYINELQQENQLLKKVFDEVLEWGQYQDRYTWKQLEGILSKLNELKDSDVDE